MAVDVQGAINRIFQQFDINRIKAFNEAPVVWSKYAMETTSSSRSTLLAWLGNQGVVREWLGSRVQNEMGTRSWEIINREWELSYTFKVNQIRDDLTGLIADAVMMARQNGAQWAQHEDLLCANTLEAGLTATCYDGQPFFDTAHPVDVDGITTGTYSNKLSGVLTHANFNAALVQRSKFKLENGAPMIPPGSKLYLVVPPDLDLAADQILVVKNLSAAASYGLFGTAGMSENPLVGKAEKVVNAYLTSTTRWYLTTEYNGMKPIILQRRQGVEQQELGPGSQPYYDKKEIKIGGDARYAASYSLPPLAITSA